MYAVDAIYRRGVLVDTEYEKPGGMMRAKCINGMLLEIHQPAPVWHRLDPWCSDNRVKYYKDEFNRTSIGRHDFDYTYIERLTNYPHPSGPSSYNGIEIGQSGIDQLRYIHDQLKNGRVDTKRLQAITWIPAIDAKEDNDSPPCLQRIWVYPKKSKLLDVHINYRSWDMFKAFEANLCAFIDLIHREWEADTGFILGTVRCIGDNVHIYEDDFAAVDEVLAGRRTV